MGEDAQEICCSSRRSGRQGERPAPGGAGRGEPQGGDPSLPLLPSSQEASPPRLPVAHPRGAECPICLSAEREKSRRQLRKKRKHFRSRHQSCEWVLTRSRINPSPNCFSRTGLCGGLALLRLAINVLFSDTRPSARLWEGPMPELSEANPGGRWPCFWRLWALGQRDQGQGPSPRRDGHQPRLSRAAGDPSHGSNGCVLPGGGGRRSGPGVSGSSDALGRLPGLRGCRSFKGISDPQHCQCLPSWAHASVLGSPGSSRPGSGETEALKVHLESQGSQGQQGPASQTQPPKPPRAATQGCWVRCAEG